MTISRMTADITIGGGASTKLILGLYADNGGTPAGGALLVGPSQQFDATLAQIDVYTFASPITLQAGFVWAALQTADATINFRKTGGAPSFAEVGSETLGGCHYVGSALTLTNPCPAVTLNLNANFCTRLRIDTIA